MDTHSHRGELLVRLDPIAIERRLTSLGLSRNDLRTELDKGRKRRKRDAIEDDDTKYAGLCLSHHTVDKGCRGLPIRNPQAKTLADFLGVDVLDLLSPADPRYRPPRDLIIKPDWEWEYSELLLPDRVKFANGLIAFVFQMQHRFTAGRLGRGKFYLLTSMQADEKARKRELLQRHADVCAKVGSHPHLAEVVTSCPSDGQDGWWVVERWEQARSLAEVLKEHRWPASKLPGLMRDIALGIQHLHRHDIVLRELAPLRVLVRENGSALLTDFEMSKLLDGSPTVSPDQGWPEDDYRASEVGPGRVLPQADIYSWGRIFLHAATGSLPPCGEELTQVTKLKVPKPVFAVLKAALERLPSRRPKSMDEVLKAIETW